jgi:hypothetical protein
VGQLTGWRAVMVVVVIVGAAILGFYNHGKGRTVGSGTWDIGVNQVVYEQITASKTTKLRAEFTPVGGTGARYAVYVLDEDNKMKSQMPAADPKAIQRLASAEGTGPLKLGEVTLLAGTYYVVAENNGKSAMRVKYELYEVR